MPIRIVAVCLLCLMVPVTWAAAGAVGQRADVRVLIDVSGSMQQTDPHNLRKPALQLLLRLLPGSARAGVWTFGHQVLPLIDHESVTAEWRAYGLRKAYDIRSNEQLTDILAALVAASYDLDRLDARRDTSIILLTDGVVDVGPAAAANAAARRRLLTELAPRLREAGVRIHPIALSADADLDLMEHLAVITGGRLAVADTAEKLQQAFVGALESAAPAEQVPLVDNRFLVDDAIDELTALVFHHGRPMVLIAPDGQRIAAVDAPPNVSWFQGQGYELVTLADPEPGEWRVEADSEPGSRITIVSDLSLQADRLPINHFTGGAALPRLKAALWEQGQPMVRAELLKLIEVTVQITREEDGRQWRATLEPDGAGGFAGQLPMLDEPGSYTLRIDADGKTFQRSVQQAVTTRAPFRLTLAAGGSTGAPARAELAVLDPSIERATVESRIEVGGADGATEIDAEAGDAGWSATLPLADAPQRVRWRVAARRNGEPLAWEGELLVADGVAQPLPPVAPTADLATPQSPPAASEPPPEAPPLSPTAPDPEEAGPAWHRWLMWGSVAVANLLVLGGAGYAFRRRMRRREAALLSDRPGDTQTLSDPAGKEVGADPGATVSELLDLELEAIDIGASDKE